MLRALSLLAFVVAAWPAASADAQTFDVGRLPRDVLIEVDEEPYSIQANSAEGILQQLTLRGPGRSWVSFPLFFLWTPSYEELPLALRTDQGSGRCRVERFEARADFQAVYPVWEASPDAPEDLVAAWTAFQGLMERLWLRRRAAILTFFTELGREVRRVDSLCGFIDTDVQTLVDERLQAFNEAEALVLQGPEWRLQWPPEGYPVRSAAAAPPVPAAPPPDPRAAEPAARPEPAASSASPAPSSVSPVPEPSAESAEPPDAASVPANALPVGPTVYRGATSLDAAVNRDLGSGVGGIVVGLIHEGELQYLEAVNDARGPGGDTLTIDSPTEFRGLTPVLVTTLVSALADRGTLDLGAPISTYLPDVDPSVGRITLEQLLTHRSGIDSAAPREGQSWEEATAALDARALFTAPDAIASYSVYNDLLVIDVLEQVVGVPLAEALERALLRPLGMTGTSVGARIGGMPATRTTAVDVFQFLIAWMNGELPGMPGLPRTVESDTAAAQARRVLRGGVWYDHVAGHPRISLTCDRAGFRLFPATSSIFVAWGRSGWPTLTSGFLLNELGSELGIGAEIVRPMELTGAARTPAEVRCPEPEGLRLLVTRAGPDAPADDWAGRYTNGERYFDLEDRGGLLKVPGENPLDVGYYGGDAYFSSLQGRPILYFRLHRDAAGRRYVILEDRAYIRDEDRPDL